MYHAAVSSFFIWLILFSACMCMYMCVCVCTRDRHLREQNYSIVLVSIAFAGNLWISRMRDGGLTSAKKKEKKKWKKEGKGKEEWRERSWKRLAALSERSSTISRLFPRASVPVSRTSYSIHSRIFYLVLIYLRFTSCLSASLAINCVDASEHGA